MVDGFISSRKSSLKIENDMYKKYTISMLAIQFVNVMGIIFNIWFLYNESYRWMNAFGLGAFISNFIWTCGFIARGMIDIKYNQHQINIIQEMEIEEEFKTDRKNYQEAAKQYHASRKRLEESLSTLKAADLNSINKNSM